jgi:hypothetical protein
LIAVPLAAKTAAMGDNRFFSWFEADRDGLLIGATVAAAMIAAMLALRWLGQRACERDPEHHGWGSVIGRALARTSSIFILIAAADAFSIYSDLPARVERVVDIAFIVAFALQGAVWARELILGMISRRVAAEDGGGTLGNAIAIIRLLVSVAAFAIAIILILENLNVNVTALVAGLGIGGIAIGLAAQGIFADLFAALSILFDKPFKKGDTIRYDNSTGTVERIGLKTTRLRSLTGEQLVMANTKLLEREIHNMAAARARRVTNYLAVNGEPSGQSIDAVTTAAREAVEAQKGCKLVRCVLSGAGAGALAFDLVYDDATLSADKLAEDRSQILRGLIERLGANKLKLTRASDQPPAPLPF